MILNIKLGWLKQEKNKNCVIGFGITNHTISSFKSADGIVVGSEICKEITKSIKDVGFENTVKSLDFRW